MECVDKKIKLNANIIMTKVVHSGSSINIPILGESNQIIKFKTIYPFFYSYLES